MYKNLAAAVAAACFLSPISSLAAEPSPPATKSPVKAAFVYVTPVFEAGWTHQHDEGRKAVEKALGSAVKTTVVDNVAEGADSERVVRDLAQQGHDVIFTTSFGYMEPTLKVAKEFPNVKFESITGYKTDVNVSVANARYYEGRYLAGVAAGRMTQSNVAGYVAGFPIPEVLQGLNAFTLGMRSVNPKAQVKVIWLNTWFDPVKERDAAFALFNQSVDVITFHTASNAVMVAAQERGKMAIAYHSDMRKVAPDAQLMAVTHEWGAYYTQRVSDVQKGQWRTGNVWAGLKEGMIRVGDFGPKLPAKVRDEIVKVQQDISQGKRHPFQGPIADNEGKAIVAAGQKLSDVQILNMNYGVAGVIGKISP
ncbi:MAG: BMP family ABC transporter substrate-binding protein [Betaproteobacteria bacterium]